MFALMKALASNLTANKSKSRSASADTEPTRRNRRRSNHPATALAVDGNRYNRRRIDRHPMASAPDFDARMQGT
jgi:hypothetical protein